MFFFSADIKKLKESNESGTSAKYRGRYPAWLDYEQEQAAGISIAHLGANPSSGIGGVVGGVTGSVQGGILGDMRRHRKDFNARIGGRLELRAIPEIDFSGWPWFTGLNPLSPIGRESVHELSQRHWELILKRGHEQLEFLLKKFEQVSTSVNQVALSEVADVVAGLAYRNEYLSDRPDASQKTAGLVRVSDVNKGEVSRPGKYVSIYSEEMVRHYLSPADVLLDDFWNSRESGDGGH